MHNIVPLGKCVTCLFMVVGIAKIWSRVVQEAETVHNGHLPKQLVIYHLPAILVLTPY